MKNREIKFRAWDKTNNKMLYPIDIFNSQDLWWADTTNGCVQLERILNSDGHREILEIQQFTGLKDKNRKEIYEGDIVFADGNKSTYVVKFGTYDRDTSFESSMHHGFYILEINENNPEFGKSMADSGVFLEKIGNIFENPELLKNV